MRNRLFLLCLLLTIGFTFNACNLDEELDDVITGEASVAAGAADLVPVIQSLSGAFQSQTNAYALHMHSSDELIGPTRGVDWSDFGVWRQLHNHTWDASHPQILDTWNTLHQGVVRANAALVAFNLANDPANAAAARFYRAYMVWQLADLYGPVPFRDENNTDFLSAPPVLSRSQAIQFVIDDLNAIIADLPARADAGYGPVTKEAAWALLAKVYLNKFIYDGAASAPAADMDQVIANADKVIDSGQFSLAPGDQYFTLNFGLENQNSPETIFGFVNETGDNFGAVFGSRGHMTLHYNQNPSGWNGFTTISDFYNKWDQNDLRFRAPASDNLAANSGLSFGFLSGPQFNQTGDRVNERNGVPLEFTVDVGITGQREGTGVRVIKYDIDYGNTATPTTDYPLIRFADIWLVKAEAIFRNGDAGTATTMINTLRQNRGVPDIGNVTEQDILDERGFELYWEGHRRTDLIRFDQFTRAWDEKPQTEDFRKLFAIPQTAVDLNPNLEQNPGY